MVGFPEVTPAGLVEVSTVAEPLTVIGLRSVLLVFRGDMFSPDSIYVTGLTTVTEEMERMLDGARVRISRARRGLSPDTPTE